MADIKTPEARSQNMAAIRSKNTNPEVFFRKALYSLGYRYRLHERRILGHPDIYLPRYQAVVFVNGCFWHRHQECKYAYTPKTRIDFWEGKFRNNVARDKEVRKELINSGIRVLVVWECTVKKMMSSKEILEEKMILVKNFLNSGQREMQI